MTIDRLSEVLDLIEVRSVLSGAIAVAGAWESQSSIDEPLKFIALVSGRARLETDGLDSPITLEAGDVAVLNGRSTMRLSGGPGGVAPVRHEPPASGVPIDAQAAASADAAVILGGRVDLNEAGRELLLRALPPVAHIRAASPLGAQLGGHVDRLFAEVVAGRPGADFATRHYAQLLLLDVLRTVMVEADLPAGWLRVLSDEQLRPALALIHAQPAKAWSLDDLARAASMSRTSFAERFRDVAGTPPQAYLIKWRMLLAQRELRSPETRIRPLALQLGYSSESAFSTAFKRAVGESPLSYRSRMRRENAA